MTQPTTDPTVIGTVKGNTITVTCPYCGKTHTHGAAGERVKEGDALGHRAADCRGGGGYEIVAGRVRQ